VTARMRSTNPATGQTVWEGDADDAATVTSAVTAAAAAQRSWAEVAPAERIGVARRYAKAVDARREELASLIRDETGKVHWDARTEAGATVGKVDLTIDAAGRLAERYGHASGVGAVDHRPIGVLAVLGPFNFPAHLPNGQIVPALLAGNAVVFKPSEFAPAVGQWLVERWREAGLPGDVLRIVHGGRETGAALVESDIDGVLFTGSYAGGRAIARAVADRPELLVALEMGGNNPIIVDGVADVAAAVRTVIMSAYVGAGQRCTCARRLIVVDGDAARRFIDRLAEAIDGVRVALPAATPEPFYGPLIHDAAADALLSAQDDLVRRGGKALRVCRRLVPEAPLMSPGLIDVTDAIDAPDAEVFGPLLQLIRVPDFAAGLDVANRTRYGLTAGLLSDSGDRFEVFRRRIRAGVVNWNGPTTGASGKLPFGGVGRSGNHRAAGYTMIDACVDPVAVVQRQTLSPPDAPGLPPLTPTP
jgi:succinylglutamic semialdehyde dehydrogenase